MAKRDGTSIVRPEDLAEASYLQDGLWYDVAHKVYEHQDSAADPGFREFVDDLIRAKHSDERSGIDPTPTRVRTGSEIIVRHGGLARPGRGGG